MHITPITRRLVAAAGIAAALVAFVAPTAEAARVPAKIAVPAEHKKFLTAYADGVQIYACTATTDGAAWTLTAPRATLRDRKGRVIGTHFGGPTWQAIDGSTVIGQRVDGVTVDPTAIPWLLLEATSTTAGPSGSLLTETKYIQRTATVGGLAPAAGECTPATVGATAEVPYAADYQFWMAKPD
jgi:hypothetical protein